MEVITIAKKKEEVIEETSVKEKVTMIDSEKSKVKVELNATSPNELIGGHVVYTKYGIFDFVSGFLEVTSEQAEKLKKDGIIK